MSESRDCELLGAYRSARYEVGEEGGWSLCVDVPCPPLAVQLRLHEVSCAAYLTACNPQSVLQSDADNSRADRQLRRRLQQNGWPVLVGRALSADGSWPAEKSYLVLGISRSETLELGRTFRQRAVLWCSENAVPQLLVC